MVGGLVEQEHVGSHEQDFGKLDSHSPSAAEFRSGAGEVGAVKAEAHENFFKFSLPVFALFDCEALGEVGYALDEVVVGCGIVVGAFGEFRVKPVKFVMQLLDF